MRLVIVAVQSFQFRVDGHGSKRVGGMKGMNTLFGLGHPSSQNLAAGHTLSLRRRLEDLHDEWRDGCFSSGGHLARWWVGSCLHWILSHSGRGHESRMRSGGTR